MLIALTNSTTYLTAAEAFIEIESRGIGLTRALDQWIATIEVVKTERRFTRDRMMIVSAIGPTAVGAVEALIEKLSADNCDGTGSEF